jgi:hypothetical protein
VEREQLTFLKRLSSSPVVLTRIAQSLVFCEALGSTLCLINIRKTNINEKSLK